jgi:hypothetical protein
MQKEEKITSTGYVKILLWGHGFPILKTGLKEEEGICPSWFDDKPINSMISHLVL